MFRSIAFYVVLTLCLAGCHGDKVMFQQEKLVPGPSWDYGDPLIFEFDLRDTSHVYRLELDIRHWEDFQWENVYLQIHTEYPADTATTDIVSFELASAMGSWHGRCRSGHCKVTIPLQSRVRFRHSGTHRITFEQYMRVEQLYGIEALRLRLVRLAEQ